MIHGCRFGKAPVGFDFAAYIISDASPGSLTPLETALFPGRVDLNNDGFPDFVDIDRDGRTWYDLTRGDQNGAHDTQHLLNHATLVGKSAQNPVAWSFPGAETAKDPGYFRVQYGLNCLVFDKRRSPRFPGFSLNLRHCSDSATPSGDCVDDCDTSTLRVSSIKTHTHGDFNGDGIMDRVRAETVTLSKGGNRKPTSGDVKVFMALGTARGIADEFLWFTSECCRVGRDERRGLWRFDQDSSLYAKPPAHSNRSVLLIENLDLCTVNSSEVEGLGGSSFS